MKNGERNKKFIQVVTPLESSDLYPIITRGLRGGYLVSLNLNIRQLPTVVRHCLIMRYARLLEQLNDDL